MKNNEQESSKIKILHIITRLDKGGSAENTLLTVMGMDPSRYTSDVLCGVSDNPPSQNEAAALSGGIRITRLPYLVREISPMKDARALCQIIKIIRRRKYDIVHTHTSKAGLLGRVAARIAGIKRIVHTPHGNVFQGYFSDFMTQIFIGIEKWCMSFTNILIALTQTGKMEHLAVGIGNEQSIRVVESGINLEPYLKTDTPKEEAKKKLGVSPEKFVVGTVARLVTVKNHRMIVNAAANMVKKAENSLFLFAGDGPLRKELEDRVAKMGLTDHFLFLGWKNEVPEILNACDVFVMCSKNEGMGRAFVEAQAAGVPCIGTSVGGIPDVISANETGFLVHPEDSLALSDILIDLYNNPEKLSEMSRACRKWVDPQFSAKRMVETLDKIYQELMDN